MIIARVRVSWEVKQVWVDIPWAQMLQIQYGGYVYV